MAGGRGGSCIHSAGDWFSPAQLSVLLARLVVEHNFAFSSPWGVGGQRASPRHYIIPEVQHSLGVKTQQ